LRRLLLGLVTALIVARPLVLGEDPGLQLTQIADASGLVLTLLWLVVAVGWGLYRMWSGERSWPGGALEAGFLGFVAMAFVTAGTSAAYKHPAWIISWECLALLVSFVLVRRLVRTQGENLRLMAAVVATGVSLSVYAIYQHEVEIPALQHEYNSGPEKLRQSLARQGTYLEPNDPQLEHWMARIRGNYVFGTFAHPNAFAGYLALLLPVGVGWFFASRRRSGWSWSTLLAGMAALLLVGALLLTHSRGGILGSLLVGGALVLCKFKPRLLLAKRALLAVGGLVVLAGLILWSGWVGEGLTRAVQSLNLRKDYWTATWSILVDPRQPRHFWLGVGPGNFGRAYLRYMLPTASELIIDPHNFLLETWATCGIFALALVLATLFAFFWRTRHVWTDPFTDSPARNYDPPKEPLVSERIPWENYIGGLAGLILGFALAAHGLSSDEILVAGALSAARSVVWLVAFSLLEFLPWTGPSRALAATAGVTALLLNLLISGGFFIPSVAQPLWIMAALALNCLPQTPVQDTVRRPWLYAALPFPITLAACLVFYFVAFSPVITCAAFFKQALNGYTAWQGTTGLEWNRQIKQAKDLRERQSLGIQAHRSLEKMVLRPLADAIRSDPMDAHPLVESAKWEGAAWELVRQKKTQEDAIHQAMKATELDPEGQEGYLTEHRLYMLFARATESEASRWYGHAAKALQKAVERNPTEARLRYQLASTLFLAGNNVEGKREAQKALDLDAFSTEPTRRLTDAQHKQIREWLLTPTP
jgi:general stress protein CsbA